MIFKIKRCAKTSKSPSRCGCDKIRIKKRQYSNELKSLQLLSPTKDRVCIKYLVFFLKFQQSKNSRNFELQVEIINVS